MASSRRLDRQVVQLVNPRRAAFRSTSYSVDPILDVPPADQVLLRDSRSRRRSARGPSPAASVWSRSTLHLRCLPPYGYGSCAPAPTPAAGEGSSRSGQQLLLRQSSARQRELQHRHARRVVLQDERRHRAERRLAEDRLSTRCDLRTRGSTFGARLQKHLHDGDAAQDWTRRARYRSPRC